MKWERDKSATALNLYFDAEMMTKDQLRELGARYGVNITAKTLHSDALQGVRRALRKIIEAERRRA